MHSLKFSFNVFSLTIKLPYLTVFFNTLIKKKNIWFAFSISLNIFNFDTLEDATSSKIIYQ